MKGQLIWQNKMQFVSQVGDHSVTIDATPEHGGDGRGQSPKELLLGAMMGCTAMDVVAILNKMRQKIEAFKILIDVTKNETHPIHFKKAVIQFNLTGEIEPLKAIKAVESSLTRYCGVNYMISKTCRISYQVFVNQALVAEGISEFSDPLN